MGWKTIKATVASEEFNAGYDPHEMKVKLVYDKYDGIFASCIAGYTDYHAPGGVWGYDKKEGATYEPILSGSRPNYTISLVEITQVYVSEPPSSPSSITVPTIVKSGEQINISWSSSSGATSYYLERSVNGGSWTQVYSGSSRSYTHTITKGWNTVAYRVRAYNSDGYSGYTTSPTRTVINNTPPTISGQDTDLGDKNLGFVISYQVDDVDSDTLIVTEKLNSSTIKTINGAPRKQNLEIEITNEKLFSLPLNSDNTIEIKVDDQNGGIAYRRYTFRRTNTAPIISDHDKDLGQKTETFSIDFSVSDNEGNAITVKTYLDGIKKEEYQVTDGATNTFTITKEDWYKLSIGQHSIKIEAIDEHGAIAVRNYTFTRFDDKIQFTLKAPIETDIIATKILVTPTWTIPAGATAKVEACNNAFDEVPTWEDITPQVLISRHYNFINDSKTADKCGINIRFTVEKGTATEQCIINGFGGAFE
ncbi:hypothetical protein [Tissierella praeacuta]|uniref:hypothetical protein n=1 Tax=Tissierella praeacuta TaxID=43131 RepID=UPI0028ABE89C|nr:hypothetical protein [Tissierella praeacuta]